MSMIFDLDLNLLDTSSFEKWRKRKKWTNVYSLIPTTSLYNGIREVLDIILKYFVKVAIVSISPRLYIEKIVSYHNILCQHIVGFHDAKLIKPHPASLQKVLVLFEASEKDVISFGDRKIDIQSSNAEGIESVACFWGTKEKRNLLNSKYCHAIIHSNEILTLIC